MDMVKYYRRETDLLYSYLLDINPRPSAGLIFSKIYGFNFALQLISVYRENLLISNYIYSGVNIIKRQYNEIF